MKPRIDIRLANLPNEFFIQSLVGIGLSLQLLIFKRFGIDLVPFCLGIGNGLLEHLLAIERLTVLHLDSAGNIAAQALELLFEFRLLRDGLTVVRMSWTMNRFLLSNLGTGLVQRLVQLGELFALGGNLRGFERTRFHRVPGSLFPNPVRLCGCVFGIELEQARRKDVRLFFWVNDVQVLFKLRKGKPGFLHFCLQFIELFLHERR